MPQNRKYEIAERRAKVAEMYLKGMFQVDIAKELDVTQQCISQDLKVLNEEWRINSLENIGEMKARELAKIDILEQQAWEAWEKSKQNIRKRSLIKVNDNKTAEKLTEIESVGDPRFLNQIERCINARCQLLGLSDITIPTAGVSIKPKEWV